MASRKKSTKSEEIVAKTEVPVEETATEVATDEIVSEVRPEKEETTVNVEEKPKKTQKTTKKVEEKKPKYPIGSIVFISKEADADLNGFKLFPQYKKYTYTVEAYDESTGVYSLRRLNLSLRLKEELILAPSERAHDAISKKQF